MSSVVSNLEFVGFYYVFMIHNPDKAAHVRIFVVLLILLIQKIITLNPNQCLLYAFGLQCFKYLVVDKHTISEKLVKLHLLWIILQY